MANASIYAAFERMWAHTANALSNTVRKFTVTVTGNNSDGYTADKTFAEIKAAYDTGSLIYCSLPDENLVLPLITNPSNGMAGFTMTSGHTEILVGINTNNEVQVEINELTGMTNTEIDALLD